MSKLDKVVENFEKNVASTLEDLKKEISSVKAALDAQTGGKFQALESCVVQGPCARYSVEIAPSSRWTTPSWKDHVEAAKKALGEERARLQEIHERNLPKIESNKAVRASVTEFMKAVGIEATYSVYEKPNNRSKNRQWLKKNAGFTEDVQRAGPISDFYEQSLNTLKDYERRINEYAQVKQREELAAQEKAQQKQKEAANLKEIAMYSLKYGTDVDAQQILDAILTKNKYLALAHYLLKNREDWNDGYAYAQQGLNSFYVSTEEDAKIQANIQELIDNWDGDGRVFRDCEYNYDRLFAIAREQAGSAVLDDYARIVEIIQEQ